MLRWRAVPAACGAFCAQPRLAMQPWLQHAARGVRTQWVMLLCHDASEATGLDVLIRGASLVAREDEELLAMARPLFDGLYEFFSRWCLHERSIA